MSTILNNTRVLVTGASSGIGREIARQVGDTAVEVILVARRAERLEDLAAELRSNRPALRVTIHACDLTDEAAIDALADTVLADGPVDVLVNNAGIGFEEVVDRTPWAKVRPLLLTNVVATAQLTHLLLPAMVRRGRGAVLFIGSGAGHTYMPRAAVYSGSKHFVHGFAESVRIDLTGTGVTVTEVAPGPVETEFDAAAGGIDDGMVGEPPGNVRISAEQCARESLAGLVAGRPLVFPGGRYRFMMRAVLALPIPVRRALFSKPGRVVKHTDGPARA